MEFNTNIDTRSNSEIAAEIVTKIKKQCKEHVNDSVVTIPFEYGNRGYGIRPFGSGCESRFRDGTALVTYTLTVCGTTYEKKRLYDICAITANIEGEMSNIEGSFVEADHISEGWSNRRVIGRIDIINSICKDFIKLKTFLKTNANYNINPTDCYYVRTSGKRGQYYASNNRKYFCTDKELCKYILGEIAPYKRRKVLFSVKPYDDEDKSDMDYSRYYETECSGSEVHSISIIITDMKRNVIKKIDFV